MSGSIVEFTAGGTPETVSAAIEQHATAHGSLSAIVVPWESDRTTLSMAVTSVRADGWAIEHTNLGTIRLTDAGSERTDVAILADTSDHPERQKLAAVFERFARQIQDHLEVGR